MQLRSQRSATSPVVLGGGAEHLTSALTSMQWNCAAKRMLSSTFAIWRSSFSELRSNAIRRNFAISNFRRMISDLPVAAMAACGSITSSRRSTYVGVVLANLVTALEQQALSVSMS